MALALGQRAVVVDLVDLESRPCQSFAVVAAVDATVVVLTEDAGALVGVGDRIMLEGALDVGRLVPRTILPKAKCGALRGGTDCSYGLHHNCNVALRR